MTSFFRNPEAFEILKRKIFPKLLQQRGDDPFRVWVLGCSTGQEAYSIAMAFMEEAEKVPRLRKLQIFATDLNDALLDRARHGLYARNLAQDVSPERLRRFFVEEEGGYRVAKQLREMVVFARQNLIGDPPFSRMDLISCRNLLIYLEPDLQKKALPTFHYALKPEGFLFLGASESIGGFTDLFEPVDKKHKIYSRKSAPTPAFHLPMKKRPVERGTAALRVRRGAGPAFGRPEGFRAELSAQREADRVTVNQFAPPGVLINDELQILQFRGPTGAYLQPPTGKASFDVLKMAREGLMLPLRAAINKARKENKIARRENVRFDQDGKIRTVNIEVIPLKNLKERCFLMLFEDADKTGRERRRAGPDNPRPRRAHDASPANGKNPAASPSWSANWPRRAIIFKPSRNSTKRPTRNSRPPTRKSHPPTKSCRASTKNWKPPRRNWSRANEELTTVNEEMSNRNAELSRLNADLNNLQTSTRLSVDVARARPDHSPFQPRAEKQFNLLAADVGQPIGKFRHNLVPAEHGSPARFRAGPRSLCSRSH